MSRRAFVVPDPATWLALRDPDAAEAEVTTDAREAEVVLVPERLPQGLAGPVHALLADLASPEVRTYASPIPGAPAARALAIAGTRAGDGDDDDDEEDEEDEEGDGDEDEDPMAITGEPSADGLVMERLDIRSGPLGPALPGGLVLDATLDGDVVESARLRPLLCAGADVVRDPLSAVAWTVADRVAREHAAGVEPRIEERAARAAAVACERAVDHLAWLERFARLLGWAALAERVRALVREAASTRHGLPPALAAPDVPSPSPEPVATRLRELASAVDALAGDLASSRRLGARTDGLGVLAADDVRRLGLAGAVARASGVAGEPAHSGRVAEGPAEAGAPELRQEGDARARALVRVGDAARAARSAAASLAGAPLPPPGAADPVAVVDGARGPLQVRLDARGTAEPTAVGGRAVREAAAALARGLEWGSALVVVASFDVSPWRVGP